MRFIHKRDEGYSERQKDVERRPDNEEIASPKQEKASPHVRNSTQSISKFFCWYPF